MAPKNLPPAAKQAKILEWFRESMGVYTIKELEKLLPSVGSINAIQVKEYIQALSDENLIRVEKIGSGNWYWSFTSDTKKLKENTINKLKEEESKLLASIADAEKELGEETAKRAEDEEMLEGGGMDRNSLVEAHAALSKELEALDRELALYSNNDPTDILTKMEHTKLLKASAVRWTDNIEGLESYIRSIAGDRAAVADMMQAACGDEYVPGEGLKEMQV